MSVEQGENPVRYALAGEIAHRLLQFVHAVPSSTDFCVGWGLGEQLACLVQDQGEAADIAWLIEIMGDCSAVLASALREDYLAKSDAQ